MNREQKDQGATATHPLSITEAIRRAIAALGTSGQVPDVLDYLERHYGITRLDGALEGRGESTAPALEEAPVETPARKPASKKARNKDRPSP